jgi:hypothetical protein
MIHMIQELFGQTVRSQTIRSLYLPLIIFWNAATGQPQVSADFAFAMTSPRARHFL